MTNGESMSSVDEVVELSERKTLRKGLSSLRGEGLVPGVIHNHGADSVYVEVPQMQLSKLYQEAGKHHPVQLKVGGKEYLALIKDVHVNPVKRRMQHIVFMAIKRDEKVEAEVPVRLEGEIPAEKAGLMVLRQLDTVEVEALPKNLPDEFIADAAKLVELHDKITVADLQVPSGVTILTEAEHPIAMVVETPALASEEAEESAEEAAEEGQLPEQAPGGAGSTGNEPAGAEKEAAGQQAPGKSGE